MSKTPYKFDLPEDLNITELEGVTEKNHIATSWEISKAFMFGRNNNPPDVVYYQDVSVEHRKKLSFNVEDVLEQNRNYWIQQVELINSVAVTGSYQRNSLISVHGHSFPRRT